MPEINGSGVCGEIIKLAVSQLDEEKSQEIKREYSDKLNKIFSNSDLLDTCFCLLGNDLNVSRTARKLYMHRNTLIYRLNKIQNITGLDIRVFDMAVTFEILRILYELK